MPLACTPLERRCRMRAGWDGVSEYMTRRKWSLLLLPMLEEDEAEARESAIQDLDALGITLDAREWSKRFDGECCPICVAEGMLPVAGHSQVTIQMRALAKLWNHLPRSELGGETPLEHLRAAVARCKDREPWECVSEDDSMVAVWTDSTYFRGLAPPEEFGLRDEIEEILQTEPLFKSIKEHNEQKVGRNAPCPCGSGRKYKRCCAR